MSESVSNLYERLEEYRDSDYYPFHMPGHKRNQTVPCGSALREAYGIDITEIDGFDNLHQAQGILLEAQQNAAKLYGAEETFFLVNGSTGGILSAVSAVTKRGDRLLMARNCHKSVYHAVYLRELDISYIYPDIIEEYGISDAVNPDDVEKALKEQPEIAAVVITSPTYEGVVSDIRRIASIAHSYGKPLIVDEAHGAHFGFHEAFPENAVRQGADIVVHSVHKTLPAMTQTALLHVQGSLVNRVSLKRYLRIFQTSSPSYVFMASIDSCMKLVRTEGRTRLSQLIMYKADFIERVSECRHLEAAALPADKKYCAVAFDPGKIVIAVKDESITGQQLYHILREKYHLQMEMAADSYVLAMLSMMDTKEGMDRLAEALLKTDEEITFFRQQKAELLQKVHDPKIKKYAVCLETVMTITEAITDVTENGCENVLLGEACDRIAAEFISLYPPGIPIVVPGEKISSKMTEQIKTYLDMMLNIEGVEDGNIKVVKLKEIEL